MKRLALISDVHGNSMALDAVLADIEQAGFSAGEVYCLGDLVGYGPDPSGVVARIRERSIPTVRGNYDDGVGARRGGCGCYYATEQTRRDGEASYAFTDAALTDDDHSWLAALPDSLRLEAEGLRVLLVHGSPRKINEYLLPDRTDTLLGRLAEEAAADVVCCGHVHIPYHRRILRPDGRRIDYVSVPSVGKPKDGDPRAGWAEVELGKAGVPVAACFHRVAYDVDAVAEAMSQAGLPAGLGEALKRA
jgi:predicted phosphodiesterase